MEFFHQRCGGFACQKRMESVCYKVKSQRGEENEIIIFDTLKELAKRGKTVIVVSHNDIVKEYADVVIKIVKGHKEVIQNGRMINDNIHLKRFSIPV